MLSILPLLLLVGVASSKSISSHGNDDALQPIVSAIQARRICATLCMSGLGGKPCGDDCFSVIPDGMRLQSVNRSASDKVAGAGAGGRARTNICPVLCANNLGYPLCTCEETQAVAMTDVDFVQVCGYTCLNLNYHIAGCQSCQVYHDAVEKHGDEAFAIGKTPRAKSVDWEEWCKEMCIIGEGGIACNCDILPMSINLTI